MNQPKDEFGRFALKGDRPLAKKTVGVRLYETDYELLMTRHPDDYTDWVRFVIAKALLAEVESFPEREGHLT